MTKPGWGATVLGHPADLAHWAHVLKEPFDPWVEVHDSETVLRSTSLDELASASDVRDRATVLIQRLNGALGISQQARPLRFGGVIQFTPDDRLHRTAFIEAAHLELRGVELSATVTLTGPDGQPVPPPPPQPSEVQRWTMVAENDGLMNDALVYFGRTKAWLPLGAPQKAEATDWFDIYKALECLILRFGPSEAAFLRRNWAPATDVKLLKQTANWARHARRQNPRPSKPTEFEAARTLLGALIRRALSEVGSSP